MKRLFEKLLNIIFPVKCACCQIVSKNADSEDILCPKCKKIIGETAGYDCMQCKNPPHLCRCKKVENISSVMFAYFYSGEKLKRAVYKLKRANLYYINEFFAKGMYNSLKSSDIIEKEGIDFITNTPRMRKSLKFYGYNQSEALARLISKYAGIPYRRSLEALRSYNTEQKTLNKTRRGQNVKNKFKAVKNMTKPGGAAGKNILIVDDVVTTGSTLSECAKILKAHGAKNIYALCAASVIS
ncbi:MAG: hypothetical protein FWD23_11810 [Oscillospiraceae bacterium]|nr:hypothetical protein [Oscillospiraceae bacterium]